MVVFIKLIIFVCLIVVLGIGLLVAIGIVSGLGLLMQALFGTYASGVALWIGLMVFLWILGLNDLVDAIYNACVRRVRLKTQPKEVDKDKSDTV